MKVDWLPPQKRKKKLIGCNCPYLVHAKEHLVLWHERVPRLCQDFDQHVLVQRVERDQGRESADEFRNHSELDQICGLDLKKDHQVFKDQKQDIIFIGTTDLFKVAGELSQMKQK